MKKIQITLLVIMALISIVTLIYNFKYFSERELISSRSKPQSSHLLGAQAQEIAPDIEIQSFPGGSKTHLRSFEGKVILLSFWASWCGPCISEIPSMIRLHEQFKNDAFQLVLLNVEEEPTIAINEFKDKLRLNFETYYSLDGNAQQIYQVSGIPHNVLIDKNFKVSLVETGPRNWFDQDTVQLIKSLL